MGKPNDKYEVEADKMADKVVSKVSTNGDPFFAPSAVVQHKLQKQEEEAPASEDQELVQGQMIQTEIEEAPASEDQALAPGSVPQAEGDAEPIQAKKETRDPAPIIPIKPNLQKKDEVEVQTKEEEEVQAKEEEERQKIQTSGGAESPPNSGSNLESKLQSAKGGGSPLPSNTRSEMESGFGADFSKVRIHTDNSSVQMNQEIGSQAFATGNDIFFNAGKFNPGSQSGKHLLAHELTHTVQQGASEPVRASMIQAKELLQASGIMDIIGDFDWIVNGARHIPGYSLFTVVAGYDPLIGQDVERTPINLLQGLLGLVPFGSVIFDKLQEYGILDQVFEWVNGKISELGLSVQSILDLMEEAWNELEFPYTDALDVVARKFGELVSRVTSFAGGLLDQVMTYVKEALINFAEPYLAENQAWSLIKKVIKYDPLRGEEVSATTVEILEDFLKLIGKETELEQMREKGTLQETADWLDTQMGTFTSILGQLRALITGVWDAVQPSNLANIGSSLLALASQVGDVLQRIWDFAVEVASKVVDLVKDSLLSYLSEQALTVRGYSLIRVIIGRDIFTGEVIERNVPNLIRGFMSLMDGGEEQYAQMEESGAIARIVGQIDAAVETLNMTPQAIVQLFTDLWNSFTINDLINPIETFTRIIAAFGEPIVRLIAFVAEIVRIVIVAILEIMNFPFDLIQNIITRSMEAIEDIKKDPIGFLKNIMRAIKQGFTQFFDNILQHLMNGVTGWLMAELGDANVPMPQDFTLQGVISWVLEILGISMDAIWEKLAEHPRIGPERVARIRATIDTLEGIWTFIQDVQERGIVAIWERIQEQLSNLWTTVLDAVKNYIMENIISRVTARLLSMLDPTGIMAVVNGAMAFYNAVQSFIRYLREMLEMVNSFVNGVADLARGDVGPAANHLESTMDRGMPVMIGFLANQVGLSGIGARIAEIIEAVRAMVDEALTWLINRAVDTGFDLLDRAMGALGLSNSNEEGESADGNLSDTEVGETIQFNVEGESHRIWITVSGSTIEVMVASNPTSVRQKITFFEQNIGTLSTPEIQAEARGHIADLEASYSRTKTLASQTLEEFEETRTDPSQESNDQARTKDEETESAENDIKRCISELFRIYGGENSVVQRFSNEIEALHPQAREHIIEEIVTNESIYSGYTVWSTELIEKLKVEVDAIARPLRRQYTFGEHVFANQAIPAMDEAVIAYNRNGNLFTDAKLRPATTRSEYVENRISVIHGGTGTGAQEVKDALQNEVFSGNEDTAYTALINYFKESFTGNSEHGLYAPIIRSTDIVGGVFIMNYDYGEDAEREGGKRDFQVRMELFDESERHVRQTVSGNNLTLKEKGTRGRTDSAGTITVPGFSHLRLNSAHVIADWFQGSGFNRALNLIVTTAEYNQHTMFNAEERIVRGIEEETRQAKSMDQSNVITADLIVDVIWKAHSDDRIIDALMELQEPLDSASNLSVLIDNTRSKLQSLQFPRKCEAITYAATIKLNGQPNGVVLRQIIGEDEGLK